MKSSPPTTESLNVRPISCFGSSEEATLATPAWEPAWRRQLLQSPLRISSAEQDALARVVPLLVCGEQSAISVFGGAANQHATGPARQLKTAFMQIEFDESGHEAAWQHLFAVLPQPRDLHRLKRRAQLFFTRLGRSESIGHHFAQVAQLDSVVGVMMWFLERSTIARDDRIRTLANQIKRDEARHVSVSRRYAGALGIRRDEFSDLGKRIRTDITSLLLPVGDALETIGVDADAMFSRINRHACTRLN